MLVSYANPNPHHHTPHHLQSPHVKSLLIRAFRNHAQLSIQTDAPIVTLIGPNGAGKTSILEALSLLASRKGIQNAHKDDWNHRHKNLPHNLPHNLPCNLPCTWAIQGHLLSPHASSKINTFLDKHKRIITLNGIPSTLSNLANTLGIFWLNPPMDNFLRETPHNLRRFFDTLITRFDPDHAKRVARVQALQRHYHHLDNQDALWRQTLIEHLSQAIVALSASRLGFIRRFNRMASQPLPSLPSVHLQLKGTIASHITQHHASSAEEHTLQILSKPHPAPFPHDNLIVSKDNLTPSHLLSSGERKALLIATILTITRLWIADRGTAPILLLDDITSHLDNHTLLALWENLLSLQIHTWISGQNASAFHDLRDVADFFAVAPSQALPFKP